MKRSEVVRDLAIFLMSKLPEWRKTERLKFADEIINELEIIGMQPPQTTLDKLVPCGLREVDEQSRYYYACWEPEDSTINTEKAINEMLEKLDNDKETKDVLTKLVPDGVKLK